MNWQTAQEKIKEGWVVARPEWVCKKIRGWRDVDEDYFASEFDHTNAVLQECHAPCDCVVGIFILGEGDLEADDYKCLYYSV